MESSEQLPLTKRIQKILIGDSRNPNEPGVFHKISLVAFLAWIGFGSDGISSSCYGPQEAFLALGSHYYLAPILALMIVFTIFIISASYSHIMDLFPTGGGGYLVASKLLSPTTGMVSGCALLVDYSLTITISIASGTDAVFSFLPQKWQIYKLSIAFSVVIILIILNLRGVKESVVSLVPIFLLFIVTHVIIILYAVFTHVDNMNSIASNAYKELNFSVSQIGITGVLLLLLHSYSLGSGTYTGIEAVSNGLPMLREPKVETGKKTMLYMAISLSFMAGGLIIAYLLYNIMPQAGKTLNAVLCEKMTLSWPGGSTFVIVTLLSEAFILFVAAQTGFLDGPRVLSIMALDNWMPVRFSLLSDRLVAQSGILLMGISSLLLLFLSKGSVAFLVVLYSINVFITFFLSQLGMVKHWWQERKKEQNFFQKISINGIGLLLTGFILITVIVVKFYEGGWLTLIITGSLIAISFFIKQHYRKTRKLLRRLDALLKAGLPQNISGDGHIISQESTDPSKWDVPPNTNTAVVLVNGFNGVGLHTLFTVLKTFKGHFKNFVFLQGGVVDIGKFKGINEMDNFKQEILKNMSKYIELVRSSGYYSEYIYSIGTDVADEVEKLALQVVKRFPNSVFFTGQLVFQKESIFTRFLHNYTAFALQKRLYYQGISVQIMPIRI